MNFFLTLVLPLIALPFLPQLRSKIVRTLVLMGGGFSCSLLILDLILYSGFLDREGIWTPLSKMEEKQVRDLREVEESYGHPYGFRCWYRDARKPENTIRIAVLGDSFVWGEGLGEEQRWTRRLEGCLNSRTSKNHQVLSWGRRGWATKQQLHFLRGTYQGWNIDRFILTFVRNDPDLGTLAQKPPALPINLAMFSFVYPRATELFRQKVHNYFSSSSQYAESMEAQLYTEANLAQWKTVLEEYEIVLRESAIPARWVLLPDPYGEDLSAKFSTAETIMKSLGLSTLNLLPAMEQLASQRGKEALVASEADGHPGPLLAELFAQEICDSMVNDSPPR